MSFWGIRHRIDYYVMRLLKLHKAETVEHDDVHGGKSYADGLNSALDGKLDEHIEDYEGHNHDGTETPNVPWDNVSDKPDEFPPEEHGDDEHSEDYSKEGHSHTESDITDLGNYSEVGHSHTESDITDLGDYSEVGHTHDYGDLTEKPAAHIEAEGSDTETVPGDVEERTDWIKYSNGTMIQYLSSYVPERREVTIDNEYSIPVEEEDDCSPFYHSSDTHPWVFPEDFLGGEEGQVSVTLTTNHSGGTAVCRFARSYQADYSIFIVRDADEGRLTGGIAIGRWK